MGWSMMVKVYKVVFNISGRLFMYVGESERKPKLWLLMKWRRCRENKGGNLLDNFFCENNIDSADRLWLAVVKITTEDVVSTHKQAKLVVGKTISQFSKVPDITILNSYKNRAYVRGCQKKAL